MRVVVTGASGNVGTSLLEALEHEDAVDDVLGLARRRPPPDGFAKVRWQDADVRTDDLAPHFRGADCVVHLAWAIQPSHDLAALRRGNVEGSRRVFAAAAEAGVPSLVYASSVGAYSPGPKDRAVDESWPTRGTRTSFYARHKAEVERLLDGFEREHPDVRTVRLRPGLIFKRESAAEQRRYFVGPLLPNRLAQPRTIPVVPAIRRLRFQAVHARDVGEAYRLAVVGDARGAFNVAADPVLDPDELARALHALPLPLPAWLARTALDASWRLRLQPTPPGWLDMGLSVPLMDTTRARRELGWQPRRSATEAILEVLAGMHDEAGAATPPLAPGRRPLRSDTVVDAVPRERTLDSAPALAREGFEYGHRRFRRFRSDVFETRLLGHRAVWLHGAEAARVFYEHDLTRRGGLPAPLFRLLQDEGSVAALDGEAHRERKAMFLSLTGPDDLARLRGLAEEEWRRAAVRWHGDVVLLPAAEELLCRVALRFCGLPDSEGVVRRRTRELSATLDGAGATGPRLLRGHLLRWRSERWAGEVVRRIRAGRLDPPAGSPARTIARLPTEAAAVELLNVLRPTVAVARYVVFAALALHARPDLRERLREDDELVLPFVQEVRRFYPFFPAIGGRVLEPFEWRGRRFERGERVLLDVHATNHDGRSWERPDEFRPERFLGREPDAYELVAQGGGDHATGHRCPGEWMTIELAAVAVRALTRELRYEVPPQDLTIRPSRLPPRPESGLAISL